MCLQGGEIPDDSKEPDYKLALPLLRTLFTFNNLLQQPLEEEDCEVTTAYKFPRLATWFVIMPPTNEKEKK